MSTRKVLVDLSKKISRASISKVRPRTSVRSLFTTERLEIKDKNIDSVPENVTTNSERWNNQSRSDLPLHCTNTDPQQSKQLDLHAEVLKNMENGKFSTRVLTAPPETYAEASVAGSDVLITWIDRTRGSYTDPITIGQELYDTRTGIRQKIEGQKNVLAIITPFFIVSRVGNGCWKIQNRSTNEMKTVKIVPNSSTRPHFDLCRSNLDLNTETVLINEFSDDRFYVINLETGQVQEIQRTDPSNQPTYDCQLYGTLIAYREYSTKSALRIVDTISGKEILKVEIPASCNYCLSKDQIALAEINKGDVSWSIIDFKGKTIKKGKFETKTLLEKYTHSNIIAYKNFLIINQGPFLHFVEISSGKLLTTLAHGNYGDSQISGYDEGKFIIAAAHSIQIVDFELPDPAPDQPVKAVVINPNETISNRTGTINNLANGLIYSEDLKPSKVADSDKQVLASQNYERRSSLVFNVSATERVTLMHFPNYTNCAIITRMKRKSSDYTYQVRPLSHIKKNFYGRGLLYKEELVDGKWVPVDLSVQQAEEFINSFSFVFK